MSAVNSEDVSVVSFFVCWDLPHSTLFSPPSTWSRPVNPVPRTGESIQWVEVRNGRWEKGKSCLLRRQLNIRWTRILCVNEWDKMQRNEKILEFSKASSVFCRSSNLKLATEDHTLCGNTGYECGFNPLKPELNPICYLLALLGAHHFLHVSRIRVKLLTFRLLMS